MAEPAHYDDGETLITDTLAFFPEGTYLVADIQSVEKQALPDQSGWAMLACAIPGLVLLACGFSGLRGEGGWQNIAAVSPPALLLLGVAAFGPCRIRRPRPPHYALWLSLGGKPELVLVSEHEGAIDAVRDALRAAIARCSPMETGIQDLGSRGGYRAAEPRLRRLR